MEYYKVDEEKINSLGESALLIFKYCALFKYTYKPSNEGKEKYINGGWEFYEKLIDESGNVHCYGIGFAKIMNIYKTLSTLKDLYNVLGLDITLFDSVFTPITKEEFYDLNNI